MALIRRPVDGSLTMAAQDSMTSLSGKEEDEPYPQRHHGTQIPSSFLGQGIPPHGPVINSTTKYLKWS
ncbi:hypothetical protein SKAU_G00297990 [Synaphobranchus kaupii]|uniref:Uncharacterized protein n=1 Tax=Synaphobranchus kaupii TaxID=118154 RepID=A0A9Q1EV23_SYNKA|nr:hypothetical protein SKAU_G00297990 [Synaphobranchus kaupii]